MTSERQVLYGRKEIGIDLSWCSSGTFAVLLGNERFDRDTACCRMYAPLSVVLLLTLEYHLAAMACAAIVYFKLEKLFPSGGGLAFSPDERERKQGAVPLLHACCPNQMPFNRWKESLSLCFGGRHGDSSRHRLVLHTSRSHFQRHLTQTSSLLGL